MKKNYKGIEYEMVRELYGCITLRINHPGLHVYETFHFGGIAFLWTNEDGAYKSAERHAKKKIDSHLRALANSWTIHN